MKKNNLANPEISNLNNNQKQIPSDSNQSNAADEIPQPVQPQQDQDAPMDFSKMNLDFLNTLAKGMSNFNPAQNRDSKVNVSAMIGNRNVNVENKNVIA